MKILVVVLLSTLKLLQKFDRPTENGSTFPDPVKNLSALPITISQAVSLNISIFYYLSKPVQFMGHGSSSSFVTQPH